MDDSDIFIFDVVCAVALLLIALTGAFLPRHLHTIGGRSLTFQIGSMFSGGVMLSAGFCHLLADALEDIEEEVEDFPLGPFLCGLGFLTTLVVDQLAEEYAEKKGFLVHTHRPTEPLIDQEENIKEPYVSPLTALFLSLSLCFHSVLEGLALGTADSVKHSIDLAVAIGAHKGLAGYALGVSIIDSKVPTKTYWIMMGTFSAASPIAVMIGYGISEYSDTMTTACLSALAAGTFLYVALMEVIPNELSVKGNKEVKLLALVIGYGLMSLIAHWA
eukprot:g224.t1